MDETLRHPVDPASRHVRDGHRPADHPDAGLPQAAFQWWPLHPVAFPLAPASTIQSMTLSSSVPGSSSHCSCATAARARISPRCLLPRLLAGGGLEATSNASSSRRWDAELKAAIGTSSPCEPCSHPEKGGRACLSPVLLSLPAGCEPAPREEAPPQWGGTPVPPPGHLTRHAASVGLASAVSVPSWPGPQVANLRHGNGRHSGGAGRRSGSGGLPPANRLVVGGPGTGSTSLCVPQTRQ